MRNFFRFDLFDRARRPRRAAFAPARARVRLESLETRTFLSATPLDVAAPTAALEAAALETAFDPYEIDCAILESGAVRNPTQNGLQNYASLSYCAVPDAVYLELWNEAVARWESVVGEGLPDVVYDGIEIDDLYVYFGFSDSYGNATSLGSSIDGGFRRDGGAGLAAAGSLVFNADYFTANPSENVRTVFFNTALHELGHALGFNLTTFKANGLVASTDAAPFGLTDVFSDASNWYYVGENGVARFKEAYPDATTTLSPDAASELGVSDAILMETHSAPGSFGAHVDSLYGTYFSYINNRDGMTYSISASFAGTITARTLGVLEDLGYSVDYDFADPCASPAPVALSAEAFGPTVRLTWSASAGDFSQSSATAATYSVERLETSAEEADWTTIATGVSATEFVDSTAAPGASYRYRVVANGVCSAVEIGLFKAAAGDELEWASNGKSFRVFALVGNASNGVSWIEQGSTSANSWTVRALSSSKPGTGTTFYRVVETGATVAASEPSRAVAIAIASDAADYVAPGYCADDWNALKTFLETTDLQGVKNGAKIAANYGAGTLDRLDGVVWKEIDGRRRVVSIAWPNRGLVGALDLTACSEATSIDVSGSALTSFALASPRATVLDVSSNALTELDLSKTPALIYLDVSDNALVALTTSSAPSLTTLRAARIAVETLDLSANERLALAALGSASLERVVLANGFEGTIDMSGAASDDLAASIVWTRDGETIGVGAAFAFDGKSAFASIPDGATRRVAFDVAAGRPATPAEPTFETVDRNRLVVSWIGDGAVGYRVDYRNRSAGNWKALADLKPSSSASGDVVASVSTTILANRAYLFRILAYSLDANGSAVYSEPLVATFDPKQAATSLALTTAAETIRVGDVVKATAYRGGVEISTRGAVFEWRRVDAAGNETVVDGATEATYSPTDADVGCFLKVVAKFNGEVGVATAISTRRVASVPEPFELEFVDLFFDEFF